MLLKDLDKYEKFTFNKETWTKLNCVNPHTNHEYDIFDCMNQEGRHRPFRDDVDVEPKQTRLEV